MSNKTETIEEALSGFNVYDSESKVIVFKNPVLNALFRGNDETGGLAKRSVVQIAAQSGTGKSTLALVVCKELCEQGMKILYIDAEKGLNNNMLKSTGLFDYLVTKDNPNGKFIIARECDCNEVNLLIRKVCETNQIDFVILDSLGSLDSNIYDIGGVDANNPKVGADTKSIKIIMKTINRMVIEHDVGFICINHVAQSIGTYIPSENPVGGRSTIYLSDVVIKLSKKSSDFEKLNLGQKVEFEITKSRYGPGKSKIPFYIRYGKGIAMIPTYREVLDKIEVDYQGRKTKILDTRGGGNGSLFIKDQELKFRGEGQLFQLIADNYSYIKSLISWKMFAPTIENAPEYFLKDPDDENFEEHSSVELPKSLSKLKIKEVDGKNLFIDRGIDSTGQVYSIAYNINKEKLIIEYNSGIEEIGNPTMNDYKESKKDLDKYLKGLEEDESTNQELSNN